MKKKKYNFVLPQTINAPRKSQTITKEIEINVLFMV